MGIVDDPELYKEVLLHLKTKREREDLEDSQLPSAGPYQEYQKCSDGRNSMLGSLEAIRELQKSFLAENRAPGTHWN